MQGEFELIADITRDLSLGEDVLLPAGDDAAVLRFPGDVAITTDILVENVHFKQAWSTAEDLGHKAVAVNVSDLEAMGARPSSIVMALAFPKDLAQSWIADFSRGVRAECELAGVSLIGGDLSSSALIIVSVTAIGELAGPAVTRSGATPGDTVAVCGNLGLASAGLAALQRGFRSPREAVAEQLRPTVPYGQGIIAARAGATAMLDISDGLLADLGHIADESCVAIDVDSVAFARPEPLKRMAAATGKDELSFILAGGEDHALAATFPAGVELPAGWQRVGRVLAGSGVSIDGAKWDGAMGWDHFSA